MIRKTLIAALMLMLLPCAAAQAQFSYQANVEGYGWMAPVSNGEVAGTTGQAKRLEALIINYAGVEYSAHVQNIGWQAWTLSGGVAGTVGQNLRIEAVRIKLPADNADIYYRAHVENIGWLGWAKNGAPAGTAGASLRLEALQIQIVPAGTPFDVGDKPAFYQKIVDAPTV